MFTTGSPFHANAVKGPHMNIISADEAWASVGAADLEHLDRNGVVTVLECVRRARSCLDAFEMKAARRLRTLNDLGSAEEPAAAIAGASGRTSGSAQDVTERDTTCAEMPTGEDALDDGAITGAHVDAIAAAIRRLPPKVREEFGAAADELLRRSSRHSLDSFRRACNTLAKELLAANRSGSDADELTAQRDASKVTRWVDRRTGMHHTMLELDPIRDAAINAEVSAEIARLRQVDGNGELSWQQLQVMAWVNMISGQPTGSVDPSATESDATPRTGAPAGIRRVDRVPEATLVIDVRWLLGLTETLGICETEAGVPIPITTARRLCCDAEVLPVVVSSDRVVLEQGRSKRTATREQRRALRTMHRTCVHPSCGVGFDACRIHHVVWWRFLGETNIDNLLPLCERHHHLVHEGGWVLEMAPNRVASWVRPDGALHHRGSTVDRR
jgi:hypothetical protein